MVAAAKAGSSGMEFSRCIVLRASQKVSLSCSFAIVSKENGVGSLLGLFVEVIIGLESGASC